MIARIKAMRAFGVVSRLKVKIAAENEKLWKCSEMCIELKKVCDGRFGLYTNNCPDGEDEDEEMCENHQCDDGYLKCANNIRCVHVKALCNNRNECQDSSDENELKVHLQIKGKHFNYTNNCNQILSSCLTRGYVDGLRCKSGFCVERGKVCDGICDCQICEDENVDFCKATKCVDGYFKCKMSGRCIHQSVVCDGKYDCSFADPSDEADCDCGLHNDGINNTYLRPILVHIIKLQCDVKIHENCTLKIAKMDDYKITIGTNCEIAQNCTFGTTKLEGKNYASINLPFMDKNYTYELTKLSNFKTPKEFSAVLSERIMSDCPEKFHRVSILRPNAYSFPPLKSKDMKHYFSENIHKSGQNELLFTLHSNSKCPKNKRIFMNDIFPTVIYGALKSNLNHPINVLISHPPNNCGNVTENDMKLISLLNLANSGLLQFVNGSKWISVSKDDLQFIVNSICNQNHDSFAFDLKSEVIFIMILNDDQNDMDIKFNIADQRPRLKPEYPLEAYNRTISINILIRHSIIPNSNRDLYYELFIKRNLTSNQVKNEYKIFRLVLPRNQRDYVQVKGEIDLKTSLNSNQTQNFTFFKLCPKSIEIDPNSCVEYKDHDHIITSITSRWSTSCSKIIIGNNVYLVLPINQRLNVYYTIVPKNITILQHSDDFINNLTMSIQGAA